MCHMSEPIFSATIAFFDRLELDNSSEFWQRERSTYPGIRETFAAVCERVVGFADWRIYRPHANRRFQPDQPPLKTFIGGVAERHDGVGAFLKVDRTGLLVGTGMPMPAKDQLPRLRDAVADPDSGVALMEAMSDVRSAGVRVHAGRWKPLTRTPKGFPSDHPRADLLRWKGIEANSEVRSPDWSTVDEAAAAIMMLLARSTPLDDWLGRHVGPSSLTPQERYAPGR
jgi:uncharacterized protein (DUF2461 family)